MGGTIFKIKKKPQVIFSSKKQMRGKGRGNRIKKVWYNIRVRLQKYKFLRLRSENQCFGSGSAWIRIDFGPLDPGPGGQE
jgi:hypothetical protein